MSIPSGYRLLTAEDVGKVFGTDLESMVYFDEDVTPTFYLTSIGSLNLTNFCEEERGYLPVAEYNVSSGIYLNGSGYIYYEAGGIGFSPTEADLSGVEITSFNTDYNWNNWFYVKDIVDPKTQFITDMNGLAESIVNKAGSSGKKTIKEMKTLVDGLKTEFVTQEKTVTPTKSSQAITPDSGKDGLSKVTVNAIPSNYIIPSGSLNITTNGTHDVTDKASVVVNVPSVVAEQWDGAYEEINSGYIVTLNCTSDVLNSDTYMYSIDGGTTYNQFTSEVMTLENITQIRFKTTASSHNYMKVGTTFSGGEITAGLQSAETENITLSSDIAYYISRYTQVGGAD